MKPPPLLVGLALATWGVSVDLPLFAFSAAILFESARHLSLRWDFTDWELSRLVDLGVVILLGRAVYFVLEEDLRWFFFTLQWLPLLLLPLATAVAYSNRAKVPLNLLLVIGRRRGRRTKQGTVLEVEIAYILVFVCFFSAAILNPAPLQLTGVAAVCVLWALWTAGPRRNAAAFLLSGVVAGAMAFGTFWGMEETRLVIRGWIRGYLVGMTLFDPHREITAIGQIGHMKLSNRIVLRVTNRGGLKLPRRLHQASFNVFTGKAWLAMEAPFSTIPPSGAKAEGATADFPDGRGFLPLPPDVRVMDAFPAGEITRNRMGAVKMTEGEIPARYGARYGEVQEMGPATHGPVGLDLHLSDSDRRLFGAVADRLALPRDDPARAVRMIRSFFADGFRYSLVLPDRRHAHRALDDFLNRSRRGHCEFFATSTVLLLRAAGIPARYAVGYSLREYSPLEEAYVARQRHAHAWALAWIDGAWRTVDTTPPVWWDADARGTPPWQPLLDTVGWALMRLNIWRRTANPEAVLAFLPALLLPVAGWMAWRLVRKPQLRAESAGPASASPPPPGSRFAAIEGYLKGRGLARGDSEPYGRWVQRLKATAGLEGLEPIVRLQNRHSYDPRGLGDGELDELNALIDGWLARPVTSSPPPPPYPPGGHRGPG